MQRDGDSAHISVNMYHHLNSAKQPSSVPLESRVYNLHDGTYAVEMCCLAVRLDSARAFAAACVIAE
jgi:hypothetical protein